MEQHGVRPDPMAIPVLSLRDQFDGVVKRFVKRNLPLAVSHLQAVDMLLRASKIGFP
jgi:hypothetical protein